MVVLSCKTLGEIICIARPDTTFFWLVWWAQMIYCFYWKTSAWSKGNPSPHNSCLIIILRCSGRKFLVWLCEETSNNKHGWTRIKYLNLLHHNRKQKQLQHSLQKILPTSYFGYFRHIWPLPSKTISPTWRNFDVHLHAKNELPS